MSLPIGLIFSNDVNSSKESRSHWGGEADKASVYDDGDIVKMKSEKLVLLTVFSFVGPNLFLDKYPIGF